MMGWGGALGFVMKGVIGGDDDGSGAFGDGGVEKGRGGVRGDLLRGYVHLPTYLIYVVARLIGGPCPNGLRMGFVHLCHVHRRV